jgi:hypothetical protein
MRRGSDLNAPRSYHIRQTLELRVPQPVQLLRCVTCQHNPHTQSQDLPLHSMASEGLSTVPVEQALAVAERNGVVLLRNGGKELLVADRRRH